MKKTYHISGMHCVSCETLLNKELSEIKGLKKSKVSHKKGTLEVEAKKIPTKEITQAVQQCGYKIVTEDEKKKANKSKLTTRDFLQIAYVFVVLGILVHFLSKLEITKLFPSIDENSNVFVALLLGIVASVSTCLVMTGGLIMSFSNKYDIQENKKHPFLHRSLPQIYFHTGRIIGFGVLGGLLGLIGNTFNYSVSFAGYFTILIAIVMFYIGLQILNIVPNISRFGFHLPTSFSQKIHNLQKKEHPLIPALIGLLTFFLPCGFTQSMQLAAVASGSFWSGMFIMTFFALGTFPVLFSVGLGASYSQNKDFAVMKKIIGAVIIFFGLYSFNSGLILSGSNFTIDFWQNKPASESVIQNTTTNEASVQTVNMDIDYSFRQKEFRIKKGIPVRFEINAINVTGCTDEVIIPRLSLSTGKMKSGTKTVLEFTPTETGTLPFSCWMGMQGGKFIVE